MQRDWPSLLRSLILTVLVAALVCACGAASAWADDAYTVDIQGTDNDDLKQQLHDNSSLVTLAGQPDPGPAGLARRIAADTPRLNAALRSAGYYDGVVQIVADRSGTPPKVTITVTPGPLYHVATVSIVTTGALAVPTLPGAQALGLAPGIPATAAPVVAAEHRLTSTLANLGYPFAKVTNRKVTVNEDTHEMDIVYTLAPGPLTRFGRLTIVGGDEVDLGLITNRIAWEEGMRYDPALVDRTRNDLSSLGLFDSVRVDLTPPPPEALPTLEQTTAPVTVTLTPRKSRFVGAGIDYATSEGIGVNGYWGHRNLFGGGEQLRIGGSVNRLGSNSIGNSDIAANASLRTPDFGAPRQTLVNDIALFEERPYAYQRDAATVGTHLERPWFTGSMLSYGVTAEREHTVLGVTSDGQHLLGSTELQGSLLGTPGGLTIDATDDLLNPTSGYRAEIHATPWFTVGGQTGDFAQITAKASTYVDVTQDGQYIGAIRVATGTDAGTGLGDIPADKRFFSGGGGSVRGYAFQKVGPLDPATGLPNGGRSLFETGAELRIRITQSVGVVPFVDAGNVFLSSVPDFHGGLEVGSGLGLRYYSPFGPLRLDVGVPLDRRSIDAPYQIYISLGQAF